MRNVCLLSCAIVLVCTMSNCSSRVGFAVSTNGDTLNGKIRANVITGKVRLTTPDYTYKITEGDFQSYSVTRQGVLYSRIITDRSRELWARVVEKGRINLYEHIRKLPRNQKEITWFVQKGGGKSVEIKRSGIGGNVGRKHDDDVLRYLIVDNKSVLEEYEQKHIYTFKNIRRLIRDYNREQF